MSDQLTLRQISNILAAIAEENDPNDYKHMVSQHTKAIFAIVLSALATTCATLTASCPAAALWGSIGLLISGTGSVIFEMFVADHMSNPIITMSQPVAVQAPADNDSEFQALVKHVGKQLVEAFETGEVKVALQLLIDICKKAYQKLCETASDVRDAIKSQFEKFIKYFENVVENWREQEGDSGWELFKRRAEVVRDLLTKFGTLLIAIIKIAATVGAVVLLSKFIICLMIGVAFLNAYNTALQCMSLAKSLSKYKSICEILSSLSKLVIDFIPEWETLKQQKKELKETDDSIATAGDSENYEQLPLLFKKRKELIKKIDETETTMNKGKLQEIKAMRRNLDMEIARAETNKIDCKYLSNDVLSQLNLFDLSRTNEADH